MSVASDIVTLFFSEFTINWATMGTVVRVQSDPDESGKPGLLTALINDANKEDIRWFWPIKPMPGSRCIVLFGDNSAARAVAIGFNKIAKIKTSIMEMRDIEIDETGIKFGDGSVQAVDTNSLELWMNQIVSSLQALYTAIQSSPTTPADGGASYKAGLSSAIESLPIPQVPPDLKITSFKYGKI